MRGGVLSGALLAFGGDGSFGFGAVPAGSFDLFKGRHFNKTFRLEGSIRDQEIRGDLEGGTGVLLVFSIGKNISNHETGGGCPELR